MAYLAIANAVSKLGLQLKDGLASADDAALALERQIKELERDLRRNKEALAETAALLVLRKKAVALWGEEGDDT